MLCFITCCISVRFCLTVMKRNFKERWLTIPLISTNRTFASHYKSLNTKLPRQITLEIKVLAMERHKALKG